MGHLYHSPNPKGSERILEEGGWEVRVTGSGHLQGNICWTRQGHGTHELSGCDSMRKTCADMMKPGKVPACLGERFLPLTQRLLAIELLDEGVLTFLQDVVLERLPMF